MLISEILSALAMIFIMIVPGFVFRKKNIIDEHQSDAVTSLAMNLTWPCLVIDAMQIDFSMEILKQSGYMMVVALVIFAAVAIIGVPLTKVMKLSPRKSCLTMFTLIFGNTGFIGIPVIKALYGSEALFFTAILELVNDVLMFTVGIMLIQLSAGRRFKLDPGEFLSPGLIGVVIGLVLFLADIRLPGLLGSSIEMIGNATTPLAMFIIGYQLGGMRFRSLLGKWQVYVISFVKLMIVPLMTLILVKLLAGDMSLMEKVAVMSFAMPVASATVLFSRQYRGETDFATKVVLLSTLLSLITIPLFAIIIEL